MTPDCPGCQWPGAEYYANLPGIWICINVPCPVFIWTDRPGSKERVIQVFASLGIGSSGRKEP